MSGEWISAFEAREIVSPGCTFLGDTTRAICRRAALGSIQAKAAIFTSSKLGETQELRDHLISKEFWGRELEAQDWFQGDFVVRVFSEGWDIRNEALGVTFERAGIEAMVAGPNPRKTASPQPVATQDHSKSGRPAWSGWEATMIEMARQLYTGELIPEVQADIEKAIADHLLSVGVHKSESTIREHARPLWIAIRDEAGK